MYKIINFEYIKNLKDVFLGIFGYEIYILNRKGVVLEDFKKNRSLYTCLKEHIGGSFIPCDSVELFLKKVLVSNQAFTFEINEEPHFFLASVPIVINSVSPLFFIINFGKIVNKTEESKALKMLEICDTSIKKLINNSNKKKSLALLQMQVNNDFFTQKNHFGVIMFDNKGSCVFASPDYMNMYNMDMRIIDSFSIRDFYSSVFKEDRGKVMFAYERAKKNKEQKIINEFRYSVRDNIIWREDVCYFFYDKDGNFEQSYIFSKDISEQKNIKLKLQKKNTELFKANLLLTQSSQKIKLEKEVGKLFTLSENLTVLFIRVLNLIQHSFSCESGFLGYLNKEGLLTCPAFVPIDFGDLDEQNKKIELKSYDECWNKALENKKTYVCSNSSEELKGYRVIRNFISVVIKESENGSAIGLLTLVNKNGGFSSKDIRELEDLCDYISPLFLTSLSKMYNKEELRLAKEKAENSDNLKTIFLRNISHEIRTPMNSILGFSEFMFDEDYDINERKSFSEKVKNSLKDLTKIVDSIVLISSLQTGKHVISKSPFNVNKVIDKLKSDYILSDYKEKDIEFVCESIENEEVLLNSDYFNILYIIRILLDNAFKFTESGYVKLSVKKDDNLIIYEVKDTGVGIKEKEKRMVMGLFTQSNESIRNSYGGLGIGLPIAVGLLKILDGGLNISSQEGKGTAISVSFPIESVKKTKEIKDKKNKEGVILVSEQDDFNFIYLKELLSNFNVKLLRVNNGIEALSIIEKTKVDVLLMCVKTPPMYDFKAIREIREVNKTLPIVIQSTCVYPEKTIEEVGISEVWVKPFHGKELKALFDKYIKL